MNEQPQNENTGQASAKEAAAKNKEKRYVDGRRKWHIMATVILFIIVIILLVLLLRQCSLGQPVLNPDYPPQQDDPNARPLPPGNDDDKLPNEEGGGAVNLQFKDKLTIDLSDKQASLTFANPGRSTQDMVLWILIQDQVIVQSGRLRPGYQVDTLDLLRGADKMLSEGVYEGKFIIYYYDPETNERAMVNTEAPVTVTVKP